MAGGDKSMKSGLTAFVFVATGISTTLLVVFGVGTYFLFISKADEPVQCIYEECGSTPGTPSNGTRIPSTACREPTTPILETPIDCLGNSCGHIGPADKFNAQCVYGHCECNATHFSQTSCLACVGACHIQKLDVDSSKLHATPFSYQSSRLNVYSCIGEQGKYADVHVLGVYENINERPPTAGKINVQITASSSRPVILVLTNYEPVDWILNVTRPINIEKVVLIAHYSDLSSVTTSGGIIQTFKLEKRPSGSVRGFGSDTGGESTAEMLVALYEEFGAVTSFAGTYRADSWNWTFPPVKAEIYPAPTTNSSSFSTQTPVSSSVTHLYADERIPCRSNGCWHVGSPSQFDTQCVNGFCECRSPNYNSITCLPSVGSCNVRKNSPDLHATPHVSGSNAPTVYSCIGHGGINVDVHVLGVYEGNVHTRPPTAGTMNVVITSSPALARSVVLVLTNYEPVNWILDYPPTLNIEKVILIAYYSELSNVTTISGASQSFAVEKRPRGTLWGFGSDSGGGHTAEMLVDLHEEFGEVASLAGTYRADSWDWNLPIVNVEIYPTQSPDASSSSTQTPVSSSLTPLYIDEPIPCRSNNCWHVGSPFQFDAQCVNGFCECRSPNYNSITCLPSVGSCNVRRNSPDLHATPHVSGSNAPTVYSCIGHGGINVDVHVLGVYEGNVHTRPPTAGTMNVVITSSPALARSVVLVLTNYEPVNWILDYPPTLNIEKVILIAYYSELSNVNTVSGSSQSFAVEKRLRGTASGYGSDSGGGRTAEMLVDLHEEFGEVASLAGTYRADSWTWNLPTVDTEIYPKPTTETMSDDGMMQVPENAWMKYTFRFEDNWNSCHGDQYVRSRPIGNNELGRYIGVILCTSDRYKLVMADNLNDEFKNIADTNGHGSDHCEFVGAAADATFTLDLNFWDSPSATGYYRSNWGEDMTLGSIGGGTGPSWTGRYYPMWYECGVSIP